MNYTVRSRDTLTSIARRFETTVDALVEANGLTDPNQIQRGQQLNIPGQNDEFTNSVTASVTGPSPALSRPDAMSPPRPQLQAPTPLPRPRPPEAPQSLWSRFLDSIDRVTGDPVHGAAAPAAQGQRDIQLQVPFYVQTEGGHGFRPGRRACFRAASQMATDAGGNVTAVGNRIQVATGENRSGAITVDPARAAEGRARIDSELEAGRPVVVGVSHKDARYNADGITDHFVTITGRGTDAEGRTFYSFNDPGSRQGQDTNPRNRFYVDPETQRLYRREDYTSVGMTSKAYDVSMVR